MKTKIALLYDDDTLMPFGKHKGDSLEDVPAYYLCYLYDETIIKDNDLLLYIEDNLELLRKGD